VGRLDISVIGQHARRGTFSRVSHSLTPEGPRLPFALLHDNHEQNHVQSSLRCAFSMAMPILEHMNAGDAHTKQVVGL
jgi:hypothetical protein